MGWQSNPFTMPLAVAAGIAATMFVLAATQRGKKGAYTLMGLFGAMALYAGAYALQLSSTGEGQKLFFHAVRYLGPALVTLAFFVFALQYTGNESLVTPGSVAILAFTPVLTTMLVWTDVYGYHNLILVSYEIVPANGGNQGFEVVNGPWYFVHAGYSLALTIAAIGLFINQWLETEGEVSKRARLFAISGFVPLIGSALYVVGGTAIDLGPVSYVISGLILVVAIFAY